MRRILCVAVLLLGGCSGGPSFGIINIILPGGRVQVGQVNEHRTTTKRSEVGTAYNTKNDPKVEIPGVPEKAGKADKESTPELDPPTPPATEWNPIAP